MADDPTARVDVAELLAAVENAPPFAAADVVGERLADALGARGVSFLIADFSGQALVRLGHAGREATRAKGRETAERVPLSGVLTGGHSPRKRSSSNTAPTASASSRR